MWGFDSSSRIPGVAGYTGAASPSSLLHPGGLGVRDTIHWPIYYNDDHAVYRHGRVRWPIVGGKPLRYCARTPGDGAWCRGAVHLRSLVLPSNRLGGGGSYLVTELVSQMVYLWTGGTLMIWMANWLRSAVGVDT